MYQKFTELCEFLDSLQSASSLKERFSKLEDFVASFLRTPEEKPSSLYPTLRLIFPDSDRERGSFNIKETGLAKIFAAVLHLPQTEKDRLVHYKDPSKQTSFSGDFPTVLMEIAKFRHVKADAETGVEPCTIPEINSFLDELVITTSLEDRKKLFSSLTPRFSVKEMYWISRIIAKDMKLHVSAETVLKRLHPDGLHYYKQTSSLKGALDCISSGRTAGNSNSILFMPVKPMLALRANPSELNTLFTDGYRRLIVETKYDGERMLVHIDKQANLIRIFSRNGKEYTTQYAQCGKAIFDICKAQSAVFDGEMVAFDDLSQSILPFGKNRTISAVKESGSSMHLSYQIFDLLYLRDVSGKEFDLRNTKYEDRRKLLLSSTNEGNSNAKVVPQKTIFTPETLSAELAGAVESSLEGLIVKDPESVYTLGSRGPGWWKIKPDYDGTLSDTLDLIVIGAYYGEGLMPKTTHLPSSSSIDSVRSFLLGAVDAHGKIRPICKVGSGLSAVDLQEIRNQLKNDGAKVKVYESGDFEDWVPKKSEQPHLVINHPKIVFEIRAGEIISSDSYPAGISLRFPRFESIRADKNFEESTSLAELLEMKRGNVVRTRNQQTLSDGSDEEQKSSSAKKAKRLTTPGRAQKTVGIQILNASQAATPLELSQTQAGPLRGKGIFVANGDRAVELSRKLGATLFPQYITGKVDFVVCEKVDFRVKNLIKAGLNVLNFAWLSECESKNQEVVPDTEHFVSP
jgi:DNA ligase 4